MDAKTVVALLVFCLTRMKYSQGSCPTSQGYDFLSSISLCIKPYHSKLSWSAASSSCVSNGDRLVIVDTAQKAESLTSYTASEFPFDNYIWIGGLSYSSSASSSHRLYKTWVWSDCTEITYNNFAPGEPSGDVDKCAVIQVQSSGSWNDGPCGTNLKYMCEKIESRPTTEIVQHIDDICSDTEPTTSTTSTTTTPTRTPTTTSTTSTTTTTTTPSTSTTSTTNTPTTTTTTTTSTTSTTTTRTTTSTTTTTTTSTPTIPTSVITTTPTTTTPNATASTATSITSPTASTTSLTSTTITSTTATTTVVPTSETTPPTTTSASSTTTATEVGRTRREVCVCFCVKKGRLTKITDKEVEKKKQEIKGQLLLDTKNLSKTVARYKSTLDKRKSSRGLGAMGIALTVLLSLLMLLSDVTSIGRR